jgi:dTDP-L-rhamnose 4-epimerase
VKALVTGGAGLIGSHIVDLLIEGGHQVRILDNLARPTHLKGKPNWIPPEADFILGDVRNREDLDRALEGVDWVFHQAADGGFTSAISHYFTNNSLPTAMLFELIRDKHPVRKVVVASSQAAYPEGKYLCPEHGPQYPGPRPVEQLCRGEWELHCPVQVNGRNCGREMSSLPNDESRPDPWLPYGLSKYWSEVLALKLGRLYKIPTVALRYSLTYGPRQSLSNPYTGICSIFSTRILNGKAPVVYEDGCQTRDFCFVEDVARANLLVAELEQADFQAFNVGTGLGTRVLDFVAILGQVYGRFVQPQLHGEFRPGDARHLVTDATRLRALGWEPQVMVEEGLHRYAAWIQQYATVEEYFSEAERLMKETRVVMSAK